MILFEHLFEIVRLMDKADLLRRIAADQAATRTGLRRARIPLLLYILKHDGCAQSALAGHMHVSPASIAVTVRRMERDGLITREADSRDRRRNHLHLTDGGRDYLLRSRQIFDTLDRQLFEGFTPGELSSLSGFLERIIQNLTDPELTGMSFMEMLAFSRELQKQQEESNA